MQKRHIFLLLLISCISFNGIGQPIIRMISHIADENLAIDFGKWQRTRGYRPVREVSLDSLASLRCHYYTELIMNIPNRPLGAVMDSIPQNRSAHRRYFGKKEYFTEPKNLIFPEVMGISVSSGLKVKAEIMQQRYCAVKIAVKNPAQLSEKKWHQLIIKAFGPAYAWKAYLGSESHRKAAEKYGNFCYGSSTLLLVRFPDGERSSKAEIMAFNVMLFGDQ